MNREALFGINFKKYRKRRGVSQREFASILFEATGKKLTLTSISNYETGTHMPPPQILPLIAEILDVSIDALFGKEETETITETVAPAETAAENAIKEWKQELLNLERSLIYWKAANAASASTQTNVLADFCERLVALGRKQQDELMVLQTEISTIQDLLSLLKGRS